MKHFKLKIFSLVMCLCICLSFLSGCGLFIKKDTVSSSNVAIVIGEKEITQKELVDAYYNFYQQNYYYYMYYSEDVILKTFYDSVVSREIILAEANKLLNSTDANNKMVFSDEDWEGVWNDVFDYIYSQIDTKEKSILLLKDSDEKNLPERLQEEEEETKKAIKHEPYEFEEIAKIDYSGLTPGVEANIDDKIAEFKTGVYKYNDSDDEEVRNMVDIDADEIAGRTEAYDMYLSDLILNAKSSGKDSDKEAVLKAEIERLKESFYESALYDLYKKHIEANASGTADGEFKNEFNTTAIANKYKELFNASKEKNTSEANYIKVITSSDNESLILYHNGEGKYTYFTVQHVLLSFDDETVETLKGIEGYDTDKDVMFREYYESVRAQIVSELRSQGKLTTAERDYETGLETGNDRTEDYIIDAFEAERTTQLNQLTSSQEYLNMSPVEQEQAKIRVSTMLFNKYAWMYSADTASLTNEKLSGVLGFTISSETDNHGTLVKDFANGARDLFANIQSGSKEIGDEIASVVSDFGVHIMMVTGVYEAGPVIDIKNMSDAEIVNALNIHYVSNMTEQKLYHYVYDLIKEDLFGDSSKYFTNYKNALIKKYEDEGLIKYKNKLTYKELESTVK